MKRGAPTHPKMLDLAARLDVPTYAAVGLVEMLFHFAATHARRGDVGRHTDLGLARVLGWSGDASALVAALADAGWLDRCACHRLRIHDWPDHCDQAVRKTDEIKLRGFLECYAAASGGIPDTSGGIPDASGLPFPLPLAAAAPVPLPVPVPAAAAAGAPPPRGNPSELAAERTALAQVLAELATLTGEPQDDLCRVVSRTGRGKVFSEPAGCSSVQWLRATRDQAEARLSAARQRAEARAAEERLAAAARHWSGAPGPPENPEAAAAWDRALQAIESQLSRHSFATWFRPTAGVALDGSAVVVRAPNGQFVDWLAKNYRTVIAEALHAAGVASVRLDAGTERVEIAASAPAVTAPEPAPEPEPSRTAACPPTRPGPPGPPARAAPDFGQLVVAINPRLESHVSNARRKQA